MMMLKPNFSKYYRYEELTQLLKEYAQEYPQLLKLESIGKSYEGRDLWLITATNFKTGSDKEKPAFWIDANIHSVEVSTVSVCLYHIHTLVTEYGKDQQVTEALDTRAFYILPRINPDGSERTLADRPRVVRSSVRPYPYDEEPLDGLMEEDIDGDGRILMMRLPDPNGTWKAHPEYPSLLIRRDPVESGGQYYRVLPEGMIKNYDGDTIDVRSIHAQVTWARGSWPKEGLDFNRNFPMNWRPESEQMGAGPYPTSEPEIRSMVDFIVKHPNIIGSASFHAFAGVFLRPYAECSDDELPPADLRVYTRMGNKGTECTGYPNINMYKDFRAPEQKYYSGSTNMWFYDHLGTFGWNIEMWNPMAKVGFKDYGHNYFAWFKEHPVADDVKIFKWAKANLGNRGYVDWYEYDHPQLGKVELGGWDWINTWANIPREYLEEEVSKFPKWFIWCALISPKLALRKVSVTELGGDNYQVRFIVENTGWLPSYVTKKALERKIRGVICEIELPEGAALETGKLREEVGQLEGRAYKDALLNPKLESTTDRVKVEWIVHAPQGGKVKLTARHDRAGVVRTEVELKKKIVN
jgi:murein tripeptide amidase MpaA